MHKTGGAMVSDIWKLFPRVLMTEANATWDIIPGFCTSVYHINSLINTVALYDGMRA